MKDAGDRSLMLGAILVALIIVVAVWFLGVSPKLSSASAARAQATLQIAANDELQKTLDQRKADAELVPEKRVAIYEIRDILPPTEELAAVQRTLDNLANSSQVVIAASQFSTPVLIPGGISFATQAEAVGLTSEIEGMQFTTLVGTPFSLEVTGTYSNMLQFIDELQTGNHRYLLVNGLTIVPSGSDETGGASDNVQYSLNGYFFTLDYGVPNISVRPDEPLGPEDSGVEPPPNTRNPFIPVAA